MNTAAPLTAAPTALPPRLYTDPALLEAEQELIFERTWQLAGHVSALPRPGSYLTAQAGTQPVLVVRDEQLRLRAYKNVCRHRGSRLLSGSGQCKAAIRCRYHGWTYRLDGSLIGVPRGLSFEERLDKSKLGLMPVRVEELCGLIFVNLDPDSRPLVELWATSRNGWRSTGSRRSSPSPRAAEPSRPTGRRWLTTTSRATTSRSPIPG